MIQKHHLLTLAAGVFLTFGVQAQIVVSPIGTTYTGPTTGSTALIDAVNWSNGLPTGAVSGLIQSDVTIVSGLENMNFVQTSGAASTGFNRTIGGMTWYLTGGSINSSAALQHIAGNPFAIYVLGGAVSASQIRNRDSSLVYIENGSVTLSGSLNMNGGFTTFGLGNGTLSAATLSSDASSRINFIDGSGGALTVAGFGLADYEGLWTGGRLQFNGENTGNFADHFKVNGATLTLVPEPTTYAVLLGILALGLVACRRRGNRTSQVELIKPA